ncbi:SpaH/EbpB family LPXTG-anchored major pilin [Thermophilibacter provencensis]|uniref:SpaH/EbpB family LPXTG-anchored major pilin n=1 Tax=Thermophilibacter provencensis TaxID=1852386 RepID=UPI0029423C1D|nr:SpaH/EbpB family LPXTG-anchored major pilin [Thermophilibacter provencensis]
MARKKSWGLRGLLAAFAAVLVALAALPATALAVVTGNDTYQFTIDGLQPGDKVDLYQVVTYDPYNADANTFTWDFATDDLAAALAQENFTKSNYNNPEYMTPTRAEQAAEIMAANLDGVEIADTQAVETEATSVTTDALGVGQYLVVVTPSAQTSGVIYQYAILNVQPDKVANSEDWEINPYVWMGNAAVKSTQLTMKSNEIPFEKTTTDDGSQASSTDDYGVWEKVPFTITTKVPTYGDKVVNPTFTISDVMGTGLSFDSSENPVTVTIDGTTYTVQEGMDAGYFQFKEDENGFTIEFKYNVLKAANLAGADVVVSYTATITSDAVQTNPATNSATLQYSNGPEVNTSSDSVDVYTFAIYLTKVDADTNNVLSGAMFGLYTTSEAAEAATADNPGTGTDTFVGTVITNEQGKASFEDLGEGTYYLKELAAPGGYQLDGTIHPIVLNDTANAEVVERVLSQTITNTKTPSLPVTGGEGTIAITATGVVLIAGAAALIVRARRQHNN